MPGLLELLAFLRDSPVRVGLVTRNTTESVDAFFAAIGEEWRGVFDIMLTREFKHVKPDKRCLLHFADVRSWFESACSDCLSVYKIWFGVFRSPCAAHTVPFLCHLN